MASTMRGRAVQGLLVVLGLVALASSTGCGGDDDTAASEGASRPTSTTMQTTTTTTTAPPSTTGVTAPAAPVDLIYPDGSTARITVDRAEVAAGDTVTATATGFAPDSGLATFFTDTWPPSEIPDDAHMATYVPDAAHADASGNATLAIPVDPVCGKGECYVVVADGIGAQGTYAGAKLTYRG